MKIKELRRHKDKLECALEELISKFETKTDTRISCVHVFHASIVGEAIEDRNTKKIIHNLTVDIGI